MPSTAPGRVMPRRSNAKRTTYGMVAVIHTTWGEHTLSNRTSHCGQGWAQGTLLACAQTEGLGLVSPLSEQSQDVSSANAPWSRPAQDPLSCLSQGLKQDSLAGKGPSVCIWATAVGTSGGISDV